MAANLMREWRKVGRAILKQTGNVQVNPDDPGYARLRARIVWKAVREYRREYIRFKLDVKSKDADSDEHDPEIPQPQR